jgi:hypothetical protein
MSMIDFQQHDLFTLYYAIMTNTEALVKSYLESGQDPDVDLSPAIMSVADLKSLERSGILETRNNAERCFVDKVIFVNERDNTGPVSPLHVAVVQCFCTALESAEVRDSAMNILKAFIDSGADKSVATWHIMLCFRDSPMWSWLLISNAVLTPCGLAAYLKKQVCTLANDEIVNLRRKVMNEVIEVLQAEPQNDTSGYPYNTAPLSVTVSRSVTETWKALLFSEKFSDIKFQCQDGTVFHAHKNVLVAASPYFSTAFEGPWGEQHEDGLWETSNPPDIMEAILSYIYTGAVTPVLQEVMNGQPQVMLAVASEYDLSELQALCEASCARSIDNDNVKSMLQLAHLYGTPALKQSCFDFVQKHMATVLTNPSMAALATEDAGLWTELTAAICPEPDDGGDEYVSEGASNKRRRVS